MKSKVDLDAIRGLRTISEIAKQQQDLTNRVTLWKKPLLEGAEEVFEGSSTGSKKANDEPEGGELYEQIGRLKVELEWLKQEVVENS